jgi:predicted Zn finger-like uncharacterized protein
MATGLATRCSACGTVFRVVPDQLRVSEGWVRCGRCSQVFNAVEALLDLETGGARRLPEEALAPRAPPRPPPQREPVFDEYRVEDRRYEPPAPAYAPPPYAAPRQAPAPRPDFDSMAGANMPVVDDSASRFPLGAERQDVDVEIDADPRAEPEDRPADNKPAEKPAFVRQAERAAVWRHGRCGPCSGCWAWAACWAWRARWPTNTVIWLPRATPLCARCWKPPAAGSIAGWAPRVPSTT